MLKRSIPAPSHAGGEAAGSPAVPGGPGKDETVTRAQRAWFKAYEDNFLFEAMHKDEVKAGKMSFRDAAELNIAWIRNHVSDRTQRLEHELSGIDPKY